ncbi:MAG: Zn-ribbon domain-containing OB-fold protein [Halobacterium sp.]
MTATECADCGTRWAYDRARCPSCGGEDFRSFELGEGVLVSTTVSRVTPPGVREPNPLGVARFGDVQVTAQLAADDLGPGDDVALAGDYELRDGERGPRLESV